MYYNPFFTLLLTGTAYYFYGKRLRRRCPWLPVTNLTILLVLPAIIGATLSVFDITFSCIRLVVDSFFRALGRETPTGFYPITTLTSSFALYCSNFTDIPFRIGGFLNTIKKKKEIPIIYLPPGHGITTLCVQYPDLFVDVLSVINMTRERFVRLSATQRTILVEQAMDDFRQNSSPRIALCSIPMLSRRFRVLGSFVLKDPALVTKAEYHGMIRVTLESGKFVPFETYEKLHSHVHNLATINLN